MNIAQQVTPSLCVDATLLATCVVLAIQTRRMINVHAEETALHSASRKAITA